MMGKILVFYFPKKTNQKTLNQFCKKFYGQNTSSHGGKYNYRRKGLLDTIPHIKVMGGVLLASTENADIIIHFLKEYGVELFVRDVTLQLEDEIILGRSTSI